MMPRLAATAVRNPQPETPMIRILVTLGVVLALSTGAALDYSLAAKGKPAGSYSFADHAALRTGGLGTTVVARVTQVMSGAETALLPKAPAGWSVRKADIEDTFRIMQIDPASPEADRARKVEKIFAKLVPGHRHIANAYEKDGQIVVLDAVAMPADLLAGRGAKMMDAVLAVAGARAPDEPIAIAQGTEFRLTGMTMPDGVAMGFAKSGDQLFLSFASNADTATLRSLLEGIDVAGLTAMAAALPAGGPEPEVEAQPDEAAVAAAEPALGVGTCVQDGAMKRCSVISN
jgi:hypothetical protein